MAEDADSKEDQFDFTSQGEAMGYISIAQARLLAFQVIESSRMRITTSLPLGYVPRPLSRDSRGKSSFSSPKKA